jgi:hypothetical protein
LGLSREERDSKNHAFWSEVWFGTQSIMTRIFLLCASLTRYQNPPWCHTGDQSPHNQRCRQSKSTCGDG